MEFGVCLPNYGTATNVRDLVEAAKEAERMAYSSIWTADHLLVPRESGTQYERMFESITTLTYLSAVTKKVKLGISSLILAMRNPLVAAKQLMTLDCLSGGRLMLAVGSGWNETEFRFLGSDFHKRGKRLDDSLRLLRAVWSGESSFNGDAIDQGFENAIMEPRPIQKRLTIWVGGTSPAAMKRAVKLGDGWHPDALLVPTLRDRIAQFRAMPGADRKSVAVRIALNLSAQSSVRKSVLGEDLLVLSRDSDKNIEVLYEFEKMGVGYVLVAPSDTGPRPVQDQVSDLRTLAKDIIPKL